MRRDFYPGSSDVSVSVVCHVCIVVMDRVLLFLRENAKKKTPIYAHCDTFIPNFFCDTKNSKFILM